MIRRGDIVGIFKVFVLLVLWFPRAKTQVSCPSGDATGIVANGQTCTELVTSSTKVECYDTTIETACCSSCNAQNTGVAGCEYGDRTTCFPFFCGTLVNEDDCCETCATTTTTLSPPTTVTTTILTTTTPPTTTDSSIPTTITTITTTEPTPPTPAGTTTLAPNTTVAPTQATTQVTTVTTTVPQVTTTSTARTTTSQGTTTTNVVTVTQGPTTASQNSVSASTSSSNSSASSTFLGESSQSKGNKDAAIIGGTIGGVVGVAAITGVAVFGIYYWKKAKRNKVSDLNVGGLPPKPDSHYPPEVVLPVKPQTQKGNRTIEPKERHKNRFVEPKEQPGSFFTHARPVNIVHEIQEVKEHRAVIYDDSTLPKYDIDTQHFEGQNGKKVITEPYLLPPLDTSGLNSKGPLRAELETKFEDTSRDKRKRKHSKTDVKPKTHDKVPNGIDNIVEQNSVSFLQLNDGSFLTKEATK